MIDENTGFEVIHIYTRREAIEDGTLIDVTDTAKTMGFKIPVAVTANLWGSGIADKNYSHGTEVGRLRECLLMALRKIRGGSMNDSFIEFSFLPDFNEARTVKCFCVCGPADDGSPCITVMLPEDY
jgi:hypothetical protein